MQFDRFCKAMMIAFGHCQVMQTPFNKQCSGKIIILIVNVSIVVTGNDAEKVSRLKVHLAKNWKSRNW